MRRAVGRERDATLRWPGGLIGQAQRVVERERLDVIVEPRAVIREAGQRASVGPFGHRAQVVGPSIDRGGELHRIALAERRAHRLRTRSVRARERDTQVQSWCGDVVEPCRQGIPLRAKLERPQIGREHRPRGKPALDRRLEVSLSRNTPGDDDV